MPLVFADSLSQRLHQAISLAWAVFSEQVGHKRLPINKEASMQLHYSYLLKSMLPLVLHRPGEEAHIELESGVLVDERTREVDLKLTGSGPKERHTIAVEMKCYRRLTASGKPRGATDIFRKDVYEDLALLERYRSLRHADRGVSLVMTDYRGLVFPNSKESKSHDYDISQNTSFESIHLDTGIGGKAVEIRLDGSYTFEWKAVGSFFFLELEDASTR